MHQLPLCSRSSFRAAPSLLVSRCKTRARSGAASPARPETRRCTSLVSRQLSAPVGSTRYEASPVICPEGISKETKRPGSYLVKRFRDAIFIPAEAAHKHVLCANAHGIWSRAAYLMETSLPSRCVGLIGDEVKDIRGWTGNIEACLNSLTTPRFPSVARPVMDRAGSAHDAAA